MGVGVRGESLMVTGQDVLWVAEPYLVASHRDAMNSLQKQRLNVKEKLPSHRKSATNR